MAFYPCMGIEQYISSWEEGKRLNETITTDIVSALVAVSNSLKDDDGLVEPQKLENAGERKAAESVFYKCLEGKVKKYFGVQTEDATRISELVFSHYGITPDIMGRALETRRERFTVLEVMRDLTERNNVFGYVQGINTEMRPRSKITMHDKDEVLKYLQDKGEAVKEKIDASKLTTTDHLAELLNQYLSEGALTRSFLRGKAYAKNEEEEEEQGRVLRVA